MGKNKGQNSVDPRGMPSDPLMEVTNMQPQNKSGSKKGSTGGKAGKSSGGAKG